MVTALAPSPPAPPGVMLDVLSALNVSGGIVGAGPPDSPPLLTSASGSAPDFVASIASAVVALVESARGAAARWPHAGCGGRKLNPGYDEKNAAGKFTSPVQP